MKRHFIIQLYDKLYRHGILHRLKLFKKYTYVIRFLFLNHSSIFELITTLQDDEDDNEKDDNNNVWDSDNEDVEWKPGKDKVMKLFIDFMSLILTLLFIFSLHTILMTSHFIIQLCDKSCGHRILHHLKLFQKIYFRHPISIS